MKQDVQTIGGVERAVMAFGIRLAPVWVESETTLAPESGLAELSLDTEHVMGGKGEIL
jgi:hypothetical protein